MRKKQFLSPRGSGSAAEVRVEIMLLFPLGFNQLQG